MISVLGLVTGKQLHADLDDASGLESRRIKMRERLLLAHADKCIVASHV